MRDRVGAVDWGMLTGAPRAWPWGSAAPAQRAGYWTESRGAAYSLCFILPALAVYEAGLLWPGLDAPRAAAEVWLRTALVRLGFGNHFLLPMLVCGGLACVAVWRGEAWKPRPRVGLFVCLECAGWAILLTLLLTPLTTHSSAGTRGATAWLEQVNLAREDVGNTLASFGAGVYEETLFRWLLLPALALLLIRLGARPALGWAGAVLATSVLFAVMHGQGGPWLAEFPLLLSRCLGGAALALIYGARGLGIAAGTHLAYDLLVGW